MAGAAQTAIIQPPVDID